MTMAINMKELASVSCIVKGIKFNRGIVLVPLRVERYNDWFILMKGVNSWIMI